MIQLLHEDYLTKDMVRIYFKHIKRGVLITYDEYIGLGMKTYADRAPLHKAWAEWRDSKETETLIGPDLKVSSTVDNERKLFNEAREMMDRRQQAARYKEW